MNTTAFPDDTATYTVDEVAQRTGTSVRTIRWYQSEGLLPPPERDGRIARYSADHVARLEVIRDLQGLGLSLTAIRRLLERAPDQAAATALAFVQAAVAPAAVDQTEIVDAGAGAEQLGLAPDRHTVEGLTALGIIEVLDDGRWRIVEPNLFAAAAELASWGVPADEQLAVTLKLREHAEAMARAMAELFVEHLWRPSDRSDAATDWATLTRAHGRLRPLATTTVVALFDNALARAAEAAMKRELDLRRPQQR